VTDVMSPYAIKKARNLSEDSAEMVFGTWGMGMGSVALAAFRCRRHRMGGGRIRRKAAKVGHGVCASKDQSGHGGRARAFGRGRPVGEAGPSSLWLVGVKGRWYTAQGGSRNTEARGIPSPIKRSRVTAGEAGAGMRS